MGNSFFTSVLYGKELTRGTAVAATKRWPGQAPKVMSDTKKTFVTEMLDVRAAERRSVVFQRLYRNNLTAAQATFEQLPAVFGCGLKGVTPTETTPSQGDYLWTFAPSMTAANSPDSLTIELGDDAQFWESEYCMFDKISLSGSIDQEGGEASVSLDAGFFGRQLTTTTKTPAIALPTGEFMNAKRARLYIDTSWAGVGGTELANLLRSFQIEILTGVHPDSTGSANQYFNAHKEGVIGVMGTFTIEGGSNAAAILTASRSAGLVVARLEITGNQIGTGTSRSLKIDFSGDYDEVDPISGEDRGDNLATFSVHGLYDTTGAKMLNVALTAAQAAY